MWLDTDNFLPTKTDRTDYTSPQNGTELITPIHGMRQKADYTSPRTVTESRIYQSIDTD